MKRIAQWFSDRGWRPFAFQRAAWRAYLAGESGLVHAPTGLGKTLAVWGGPLIEGCDDEPVDAPAPRRSSLRQRRAASRPLRALWLTPLRALAADTTAALSAPVAELGLPWTVEQRTGDTATHLRAAQRERLPTALVTTPESLSVLLSYPEARERFSTLRCVIVDEWHELLGTKRGVQTELALARLRRWQPALRVWGLSATLGNLEQARDVLGGADARGLRLIESRDRKRIEIETLLPDDLECFPWSGHLGTRLIRGAVQAIERARSALLFTNTRSQAELWFQALLRERPDWLGAVALHHGSLDHGVRGRVERMLAEERLKAVVCTSSLDLGVDFSPVDTVFQIGSPKGIVRLLQRAGRSGHQPGAVSRIVCVPTHAFELVEFAAVRDALAARRLEARTPLEKPLDVLAQHLVTVAAGGGFQPNDLLAEVRSTHAYRDLHDEEWNWTLDFAERGGAALTAYPRFARVQRSDDGCAISSPVLARTHRTNIGTITGEQLLAVRMLNGRKLGAVEEYFIARLAPGERFVFGGHILELVRVRDMTVHVRKARGGSGRVPRWNGGRFPLSTQLAAAVRARLTAFADNPSAERQESAEMARVAPLLQLQAKLSDIPDDRGLLFEHTESDDGHHWFVFPFEGRLVHEGIASLLAYRLTSAAPLTIDVTANDYGFELLTPGRLPLGEEDWRRLLSSERLVDDLLACLNCTQMARRQFRDIARIAGLVQQGYPGAPRPSRQLQASSELFFDVFSEFDPDNLLLRQARREVLEHQLEIRRLTVSLQRIAAQPFRIRGTAQLTPLSFPLSAERLRAQHVSSERWAERVQRMSSRLASGESSPPRRRSRHARSLG